MLVIENKKKVKKMDKNEIKKVVALTYKKEERSAPTVIAQGNGKFAEQLLIKAIQSNVPIYKNPELLYELSCLNILEEIPDYLYGVVAEVLAFIYKMEQITGKEALKYGAANA